MKILMICYEFPPLGGGGAKVLHGLAKELVMMGHEVDIVTMHFRGMARTEKIDGINIYRVPCIRLRKSICSFFEMIPYLLFAIPLVLRLLKQKQYDINHTHFIFPDGVIAYVVNALKGFPYLCTAHGSDVPGYNPNRFRILHRILVSLWRKIVKQSLCIVCPSRFLEQLVVNSYPKASTILIPNGFTLDRFVAHRPKRDCILVVSRMFERKGIQYFLYALKDLDLQVDIHIVGNGPYLDILKKIAKDLSTPIQFHGFLDNKSPELRELFETSKIFVFPSKVENFPVVLLEAMAAGMAIITTEGTGCGEVVRDTALLVPSEDPEATKKALLTLLDDNALCEQLGTRARKRLEDNFSWRAITNKYKKLYIRYTSLE